ERFEMRQDRLARGGLAAETEHLVIAGDGARGGFQVAAGVGELLVVLRLAAKPLDYGDVQRRLRQRGQDRARRAEGKRAELEQGGHYRLLPRAGQITRHWRRSSHSAAFSNNSSRKKI